jgi:hypothetical protein
MPLVAPVMIALRPAKSALESVMPRTLPYRHPPVRRRAGLSTAGVGSLTAGRSAREGGDAGEAGHD